MIEKNPNAMENNRTSSNDIVQLHHLSHLKNHLPHVNTQLLKKSQTQARKKRKKRKRKDGSLSDSVFYYFKNHSYNHITTDNKNGDHIIKSNSNENRRRMKARSLDSSIDTNQLNHARTLRKEGNQEKNLTFWIFRIKSPVDKQGESINVDDKVKSNNY